MELIWTLSIHRPDMFILRKYALRLKNRIKDYNTQHPDEPMSDEYGKMEIPVAG